MAKQGHDAINLPGTPFGQGLQLPHAEPGMTIGLFGGSFNPPHEGHLLVTRHALTRAGLDQIWWLVTPGNPLKDRAALKPITERIAMCEDLVSDRRIKITGLEARFATRYTYNTLKRLCQVRPGINFVWVMGADSLQNFHAWHRWREIAKLMPMVVVDRPNSTFSTTSSKAAIFLAKFRKRSSDASLLSRTNPPSWTPIYGPRSNLTSTKIREKSNRLKN